MTTLEELDEKLEPHWAEHPVWREATIGEGWADLVSDLIDDLEQVDPDFKVAQVKEKFGGLRFYLDLFTPSEDKPDREVMNGLIRAAEMKSFKICEVTGKPGEVRTDIGWIVTLCDEEYEKRKREKNGD